MNAICHNCGSPKQNPMQTCDACQKIPQTEDEIAIAFMLTVGVLGKDRLMELSTRIRNGRSMASPQFGKTVGSNAFQDPRVHQHCAPRQTAGRPLRRRGVGMKTWGISAAIAFFLLLLLFLHPWPHYSWAKFKDEVSAHEGFLARFPSSIYTLDARERMRILSEDRVWEAADKSGLIEELRSYARSYPDGKCLDAAKRQITDIADQMWIKLSITGTRPEILKFLGDYPESSKIAEAKDHIVEIANNRWALISQSRSVLDIRHFLTEFPETTKKAEAEARIQFLYDDFDWVVKQDSLEHYRRFASRFPSHPRIATIEKRIIDLEVKEIAAGQYGAMPQARPISHDSKSAEIEIENKTGYELTVRYSGPDSKKLVIPVGATRSTILAPGVYKIAASVSAAHVTNYYGTDTMQGGRYLSDFYIKTGFGNSSFSAPEFSVPETTFRRKRK
jgi:hypothetical protein